MKAIVAMLLIIFPVMLGARDEQDDPKWYIIKVEGELANSLATGETAVAERVVVNDFVGTDPDGNRYDRDTLIQRIHDGPKNFLRYRTVSVKVTFFAENVVVAQGTDKWTKKDGKSAAFVWTHTWVGDTGKWRIVASQEVIAPAPYPR